jgi:lipopolysaccharide export system protein LptA
MVGVGLATGAAAVVDVSGPPSGIAIAPFVNQGEGDAPLGLGSALARELGETSKLRVVSPPELRRDERGLTDPMAEDVRRWADWNRVENVVIGRRDGLDVRVELRSGHSGGALAEYRLEPDSEARIPGVVRELANLILADLGEPVRLADAGLPPVSAAAPESQAVPTGGTPEPRTDEAEAPADSSLALLPGPQRDDPISINSDELEVLPESGGRRLVFSRNVEVLQGNITLNADRLEAVYPQGASQPDRLVATGHVRVHQGDRRARCDEATYERTANTIVCRGKAEVTQGCDRVRGREIEFDLERERVRVSGAASVVIQSEDSDPETCAAAQEAAP